MQRPVGLVAVFGASNFPLAFSIAGGDTTPALAAGRPVLVRGHAAHSGTAEIVAEAVAAAAARCGVHPGVFSLLQGGGNAVGAALVAHPLIRAVGFTGSLAGGRALFDLCAARPEPIPFFGELGSVNPMFVLPEAAAARGGDIARGWAASLTMGAGHFCTNPGVVVLLARHADAYAAAAVEALGAGAPQTMLTRGIADAFGQGCDRLAAGAGVRARQVAEAGPRAAAPRLFTVSATDFLADPGLAEEVFGPAGLIVTVADADEMVAVARAFHGQLTAALHPDPGGHGLARRLAPILERMAGRVRASGFPTGVEVCDAMVHGGPYPASTNFDATSVGTLATGRFLRPVCWRNMPADLLPTDLR